VAADPTFATGLVTSIHNDLHAVRASSDWPTPSRGAAAWSDLASRAHGLAVTDHRSSFVRRRSINGGDVFLKVYEYETWADRIRSFGRRTGPFATPRAVREFDALAWLRQHGFAAPRPLCAAVERRLGFVARALLITEADPGTQADVVLPTLDAPERMRLVAAIERLLQDLHHRGFRDGNFDLRNLLVARDGTGWRIAKIDSPRYRLVAPGARDDRLARADWARLRPQLAPFASRP
jgi:hypothetical protein